MFVQARKIQRLLELNLLMFEKMIVDTQVDPESFNLNRGIKVVMMNKLKDIEGYLANDNNRRFIET